MSVKTVQIGQLWRANATSETWVVTKTYKELFTTYVVLRRMGGAEADVHRLRVQPADEGPRLEGFTRVEESA